MNKQEIIEKLEKSLTYCAADYDSGYDDGIGYAIALVKQLDEPEKPVVPQYVADWYEDCKGDLEFYIYDLCADYRNNKLEDNELREWFGNDSRTKPIETLMKMKFYDYEVKKEKLYTARVKGLEVEYDKVYINQDKKTGELFIDDLDEIDGVLKVYFTKEELKKLGLWDNVLIEIEEG